MLPKFADPICLCTVVGMIEGRLYISQPCAPVMSHAGGPRSVLSISQPDASTRMHPPLLVLLSGMKKKRIPIPLAFQTNNGMYSRSARV